MDMSQYLRILREQWLLIVGCVMAATVIAGIVVWTATPIYQASTKLFVSTTTGDGPTGTSQVYQGSLFSQERVKSYADIVNSLPVTTAVVQELKLPETPQQLAAKITATAPLDTVLIQVDVKDPSPQKAKQIADAVSEQFSKQVAQIETPPGAKTSPVKVSVVQPATLPSTPVSPKTKLDLALGLLIGLIIGIGGAVLRAKLDNTIHDRDEAAKAADASVLATLNDDEAVEERPLIVQDEVFSPRVEAFRRLRTNIRFVGVDETLRALVVTSADPGEGKTTVASNLAIALAQAGEKVILVDADMRHPKVAERFGLNPATGLSRALFEPDNVDRFLQGWRDDLPLRILTSGPTPPNPTELLGSHRMRQLIEALKARSTVIIFDSPPLLPVSDAAVLTTFTDGALLVARANHTRRDSLAHAAEALHAVDAQVLGVVLNRVRATGRALRTLRRSLRQVRRLRPGRAGPGTQAVRPASPAEASGRCHPDDQDEGRPSAHTGCAGAAVVRVADHAQVQRRRPGHCPGGVTGEPAPAVTRPH